MNQFPLGGLGYIFLLLHLSSSISLASFPSRIVQKGNLLASLIHILTQELPQPGHPKEKDPQPSIQGVYSLNQSVCEQLPICWLFFFGSALETMDKDSRSSLAIMDKDSRSVAGRAKVEVPRARIARTVGRGNCILR
jgi:hypothetical protein